MIWLLELPDIVTQLQLLLFVWPQQVVYYNLSESQFSQTSTAVKHLSGYPGGSVVKNLTAKAGDAGSIPGSGKFPGERNGNPVQYSCLENPMDRRAWRAAIHEVAKSQTRLSVHTHSHWSQRKERVLMENLIRPLVRNSILRFIHYPPPPWNPLVLFLSAHSLSSGNESYYICWILY